MPGVGQCLCIRTARTSGIDRCLMLAVELLHREQPWAAARGERLEHHALQPVVLRVVVNLAEDHVPRARGPLEQWVGRDKGSGACVPDLAGERMLLDLVGTGGQRNRSERDQELFRC